MDSDRIDPARRGLLKLMLLAPVVFAAGVRWGLPEAFAAEAVLQAATPDSRRSGAHRKLAPTPDCDDDEPTPAETAGPFFKARSPLRTSLLEEGMSGTRLLVSGRVFSRACQPVSGALLDFWHADDQGEYDNEGFRLRGHQFADDQGRYQLETIVPGLYQPRTRHIHVRVQAPHGRVLTTQLYFPGEPDNRSDGLFRTELLMAMREGGARRTGQFNFVLG